MYRKFEILIAVTAVVLVLAMMWMAVELSQPVPVEPTAPPTEATVPTEPGTEPTEPPTQPPTEPVTEPTAPPTEPATEATESPTQPPTQPPTEPSRPQTGGNGGTTSRPNRDPEPTEPTEPPTLTFPYAIPGTSLVIERVDSYDGIFLEDGSDTDVSGITAMVLRNSGRTCAELAMITMTQGDRTLTFKVTALPAGATVVVQESGAAAYRATPFTACKAEVAELAALEMSAGLVEVRENEKGTLTVTNLTDTTIPCVRVFYKFCMESGSVYVGGITYTAKIVDLAPGVPQEVAPSHYAAGYSEVIMVRTYATAD